MGRPKNGDVRRTQILDALRRVMAANGYAKASIADIAHEAGLSPGLVHYHFHDKMAVLVSLVAHLGAEVRARADTFANNELRKFEAIDGDAQRVALPEAQRRLEGLINALVATSHDADPVSVACWVQIAAEATRVAEVREVYAAHLRMMLLEFTELLFSARQELRHPTSRRRARRRAALLLASIEGSYLVGTAAPGLLPAKFASPEIRAIARSFIHAKPRRSPSAKSTVEKDL